MEEEILESFGLNPEECDIEVKMGENNSYWIGPKKNNMQISSTLFKNQNIFNKYELSFYNCNFETPISLKATFTKPIRFIECRFLKEVSIEATFNESVSFVKSSFEGIANFDKSKFLAKNTNAFSNTTFKKRFSLSNAIFKARVSFKQSMFDDNAYFIGTKFFDVDFQDSCFKTRVFFSESVFNDDGTFNETTFNDDARFDMVTFKGQADFCRCQFDKSAYFYETLFKKFPNFIQTTFDGSVNFTNTELDFDYRDIENKIREIYKEKLKYYNEESGEHYPRLYKVANEIRNIFRNIKNSLIKDRNMLDASNYHRFELYCKELELAYKRKEDLEKTTTRDFVDRIQLYCYRVTSDHHTDLFLILNNIIFLIALFGIISLGLEIYFANNNFVSKVESLFAKANETNIRIIFVASLIFMDFTFRILFGCYKLFISKSMYCALIFLLIVLVTSPAFMLLILSIIAAALLFVILSILLLGFYCISSTIQKRRSKIYAVYYRRECLQLKQCAFVISYPITTIILTFKPKQLMPIIGKLIDDKDSCCCCDDFDIFEIYLNMTSFPSETLNLIYMLFLFLLLWSLQKTARKNTIVPN